MEIARLIKTAAIEAVEAEKPVAVMFATVINTLPLTVDIEQNLQLSGERLTVLGGVKADVGDTLVLLREQGGQRFVVIGTINKE